MISVALTVYNAEKYLREQVESILNQTINDVELIIVDDKSTDGSYALACRLASQDSRVHAYQNAENLGFLRNFERAISLTHGEYVALSDCDDVWAPDHLEQLLNGLGSKSLACGNCTFIDEAGNDLSTTLKWQESLDWIPADDMKKLISIILFRNPYQGATMLMRRQFANFAMPIPATMKYHDTWLSSLACVCDGIAYVDKPLLRYRRRAESITGLRIKRKSKAYRFLHPRIPEDRVDVLDEIEKRCAGQLTQKQKQTIRQLKTVASKIIDGNVDASVRLFELLHYKEIYSCNITHWI